MRRYAVPGKCRNCQERFKTTVEAWAETVPAWHDPMENEVLIVGTFVS